MKSSILILHHDDRDGFMSAAVICKKLKEQRPILFQDESSIITQQINYEEPLSDIFEKCLNKLKQERGIQEDFETIYLVDYSIYKEENVKALIWLKENYNLIWIDHHESSLKKEIEVPVLKEIKGIRIIGISGAGLCWLYYNKSAYNVIETINKFNHKLNPVIEKKDALELLENINTPLFVLYTHRYDIFDLNDDVLNFNYGFNELNVKHMVELISIRNNSYISKTSEKQELEYCIRKGKYISSYLNIENEKIVKENGVEFYYIDEDNNKYKCLTLNHSIFTSLVYGDKINDYDFVFTYVKKRNLYRCSLYASSNNDVNVSKIANRYGGGGHQKAAGFVLNKPFWELDEWKMI